MIKVTGNLWKQSRFYYKEVAFQVLRRGLKFAKIFRNLRNSQVETDISSLSETFYLVCQVRSSWNKETLSLVMQSMESTAKGDFVLPSCSCVCGCQVLARATVLVQAQSQGESQRKKQATGMQWYQKRWSVWRCYPHWSPGADFLEERPILLEGCKNVSGSWEHESKGTQNGTKMSRKAEKCWCFAKHRAGSHAQTRARQAHVTYKTAE